MPKYVYECLANGKKVEVSHPSNVSLECWGQLCYVGQIEMGSTSFKAPVKRVIGSPKLIIPTGNTRLKENGFTKLIKRDEGVYENVTALDGEEKYMIADSPETVPRLDKKIKD